VFCSSSVTICDQKARCCRSLTLDSIPVYQTVEAISSNWPFNKNKESVIKHQNVLQKLNYASHKWWNCVGFKMVQFWWVCLARKAAKQIINDLSARGTDKHVNHLQFFVYAGKESYHYNRLATSKSSDDFWFEIKIYTNF